MTFNSTVDSLITAIWIDIIRLMSLLVELFIKVSNFHGYEVIKLLHYILCYPAFNF